MNLLEILKDLVTPEPQAVAEDESFPDENAPGYYLDTSVQQIVVDAAPKDVWAPTVDQSIPYRGVEEHGVPFDSSGIFIAPTPQAEVLQREHDDKTKEDDDGPDVDLTPIDPIPVTVVEMPASLERSMRVATSQFHLDQNYVAQLAPQRQQRTKLVLTSLNGTVLFATYRDGILQTGFPIPLAGTVLELDVTQAVYAVNTAVPVDTVYVLEEFPVSTNEYVS